MYRSFYPDGWCISQQKAVEAVCAAEDTHVWVAMSAEGDATGIDTGSTVGFVAVKLHSESSMGEVHMVAVDPDFQGQGIGTALMEFALS